MDAPKEMATPFWGAQTSYLNFCEEDYVVTRYIAEFINTLSSLVFVVYGIYGLWSIRGKPQPGARIVSYCGLMGVGLCSAGYHMTLKYHTQMSDELSMHLLITPLLYRILTFKASVQRTYIVGTILSIVFTVVMVVHMVADEFLLHATSFGIEVYLVANRSMAIIRKSPHTHTKEPLRSLAIFGCASFLGGFLVWLIDQFACSLLTDVKRAVDVPWAWVLELHGWWHVLTAIGGYAAVSVVDAITLEESDDNFAANLAWPLPWAAKCMQRSPKPKNKE